MPTPVPDGYYAVADPDHPGQITYWRARDNHLKPWPARAKYGPVALRKDVPKQPAAKKTFLDAYWERCRQWHRKLRRAIESDPATAMGRFADFSTRCGNCGRPLTDDKSKVLGLGPDCRDGLNEDVLEIYNTPAIGMAHALFLARHTTEET